MGGEMDVVGEIAAATVKAIIGPLVGYAKGIGKRKTKGNAGKLHFWSEGMLQELQLIAKGKATAKTYKELGQKFRRSQGTVDKAMVKLKATRNSLGGGPIARQINECIHNYDFGKMTVRDEIEFLIERKGDEGTAEEAQFICRRIETLNAELDRLFRLLDAK